MPKREKRTKVYVTLNAEGMAALELLRMSTHGVPDKDIVNAALCTQAGRISTATKDKLIEVAARRESDAIKQLRAEVNNIAGMNAALLEQVNAMAEYIRSMNKLYKLDTEV